MMNWWNSRPEWLRWILYLPAVFILPPLGCMAMVLPVLIFLRLSDLGQLFLGAMCAGFGAALIAYLSFNLAPRWKKPASTIVIGVMVLGGVLTALIHLIHRPWGWNDAEAVVNGSISVCFSILSARAIWKEAKRESKAGAA